MAAGFSERDLEAAHSFYELNLEVPELYFCHILLVKEGKEKEKKITSVAHNQGKKT